MSAATGAVPFGYRPGDSVLHRLHPLTKLLAVVVLAAAGYVAPGFALALVATLALAVCAAALPSLRGVLRTAGLLITPLAVAILVIQGLLIPGRSGVVGAWGPFTVSTEGLAAAAAFILRLTTILFVVLLLLATTTPKEITVALTGRGVSPKLAYVVLAAMQFIPDAQHRQARIVEAQQARGMDIRASLRTRVRSLMAVVVPLFTGALITAETRALALEARGFNRPGPRTSLLVLTRSAADTVVRAAVVAVLAAAVAWRVITWL